MQSIRFDFNNMMASVVGQRGFSKAEIEGEQRMAGEAHSALLKKAPGFMRLPKEQAKEIDHIAAAAAWIRKEFKNFVVLGIGGSALGPIAVEQALGTGSDKMRLFVEDNVDPERLARVFGALSLKDTVFNVITKSGKTSETMAQMMYIAGALGKAGLPLNKHIIATTDGKNGDLVRIVQKEGLEAFVIPADVGGRFSELTPVGLLPAAVCGQIGRAHV